MRFLPGVTTIEVMITMLLLSIVILSTSGAKIAAFQSYRDLIHRERALLYATETLEILEAMKRTRMAQNYPSSWKNFLGGLSDGRYQLTFSQDLKDYGLRAVSPGTTFSDNDLYSVKIFEEEKDIFTRLERNIELSSINNSKLITVSVYFGKEGNFTPESISQVSLQALFSDITPPGYAL